MNMQTKPPHTAAEQAIVDSFAEMIGQLPGDAPVTAARDKLLSDISTSGLPTRRIESWHYTDLRNLMRDLPKPGERIGHAGRARWFAAGSEVLTMVGRNAIEAPHVSVPRCQHCQPERPRKACSTRPPTGAHWLSVRWSGFTSFTVAAETVIDEIIEIQSVQSGGQVHNRYAASFGAKAGATVIERYLADTSDAGLSTAVSSLELADGAEVTWIILQGCGDADQHLGQLNARLGADAKLKLYVINAGGKLVRQELHVEAAGEGAHLDLRCVNLLAGESHTDVTLTLGHNVPNTTSSEIVRNVVLNRARGVSRARSEWRRSPRRPMHRWRATRCFCPMTANLPPSRNWRSLPTTWCARMARR